MTHKNARVPTLSDPNLISTSCSRTRWPGSKLSYLHSSVLGLCSLASHCQRAQLSVITVCRAPDTPPSRRSDSHSDSFTARQCILKPLVSILTDILRTSMIGINETSGFHGSGEGRDCCGSDQAAQHCRQASTKERGMMQSMKPIAYSGAVARRENSESENGHTQCSSLPNLTPLLNYCLTISRPNSVFGRAIQR